MEGKEMKNNSHYVAMAGFHGCMPNVCESHDSYDDAVDSMASLHELGKKRTRELKKNGYIELNIHKDGNEYAEITDCDCTDPDQHNDY
jgi:hypothetical protein